MFWKHREKAERSEPVVEPPCHDCVEARFETKRGDATCERHARKHIHGHAYHYHREHSFRTHDSNVIPTGVEPR